MVVLSTSKNSLVDMKKIATMFATLLLVTLLASASEAKTVLPTLLNAKSSVFDYGIFPTTSFMVNLSDSDSSPPKPLVIVSPTVSGKYPVIQFHHGFQISSSDYSDLFELISSHGYIVVAPQLYRVDSGFPLLPNSGQFELNSAARVANWLLSDLSSKLPTNIKPDLTRLIISGHSRGGKVAFALALGKAKVPLEVQFSALVGVDPVEGTDPNILTKKPNSFNLTIPVGVIGTGLGSQWNLLLTPCAPDGRNHKEFFNECKPPCDHFVTTDYGHMDMLNDQLSGLFANSANIVCRSGVRESKDKEAMRRTVGGIFVAFLKAHLYNNWDNYYKIIEDPAHVAPVKLDDPEIKAESEALMV